MRPFLPVPYTIGKKIYDNIFFVFSGHCASPSAISSDYLQNNDLLSMTRRTTTSSTYSSSRHGRSPGSYDNQYQNIQTIGNGSNSARKKTNTIDVMEMDRLRNGDLLMENSRKRYDMAMQYTDNSDGFEYTKLSFLVHTRPDSIREMG